MENHSAHSENTSFFQQLDICCQKIAELIGDKQISEWTNGDYINLSRILSKKTRIRLSESTLKRIFGKSKTSERYYPQKATRDALAQFIGYKDWNEFEFRDTGKTEIYIPKIKPREYTPNIQQKNRATWLVFSIFLGISFILTLLVLKPAKKADPGMQEAKLVCVNPEGDTPHSAIFRLEQGKNRKDSLHHFSIDFRDGRSKRKNFTNHMLNHYYEVPGRYYPLLFYKKNVMDTAYVYLQTKGWSATGSNLYDTTRVYPVSRPANINTKLPIGLSIKEVFRAGVDTSRTFFISFSNVKPTHISADNFELSVAVRTSADRPGVRCSQVDITVYGETDQHHFGIIKPACTVWTSYQFSENVKHGSDYDLRDFGHDFSRGGILNLNVKNKKVTLSIDGKPVYRTSYNRPIGNVMGVELSFAGIGEFENFQVKDLKTGEHF